MSSSTESPISPTQSAASRVPQEILDKIIQYAQDDIPSLLICSLVCRAWLSASRFRLFKRHFIHDRDLYKLIQLLKSPHATLARYIHCLTVGSEILVEKHIWPLPPFSSLEILRLSNAHIFSSHHLSQIVIQEKFPMITSLVLWYITFDTFEQCTAILSSLPRLEHLSLLSVHVGSSRSEVEPNTRDSRLSLRSFSIERCRLAEWFTWLLTFDPIPPLRTIRVGNPESTYNLQDDNALSRLFGQISQSLGSNLENIYCDEFFIPIMQNGGCHDSQYSNECVQLTLHSSSFCV